jgi:hypothetical protein
MELINMMFKKMFGLLIVGLMLACGTLSGVNAENVGSKFQDNFNFDFKIGEDYELYSTYLNGSDHAKALAVLKYALLSDNNLVNWGTWNRNSTGYKVTSHYGFDKSKSGRVIDIILSGNKDSFKTVARGYKPYNKSSVIEVSYNCTLVNTTVNINIHE